MGKYKFMQNGECEFFPCHKGCGERDFNCLFCYCPLYYDIECGGSFTLTKDGVKDCTSCLVPHKKENYDLIISRIAEFNKRGGGNDE